jgi:uncharacterized transporter YbjL
MLLVIGFLFIGILVGFGLRKVKHKTTLPDKLINLSVYLLLFILGLKAGSDKTIVTQLHSLGLTALLISLFTLAGSILVSWLFYHLFFKKPAK